MISLRADSLFNCTLLPNSITQSPLYSLFSLLDHSRILDVGLALACHEGSCGGISLKRDKRHLHLKTLPALASLAS